MCPIVTLEISIRSKSNNIDEQNALDIILSTCLRYFLRKDTASPPTTLLSVKVITCVCN